MVNLLNNLNLMIDHYYKIHLNMDMDIGLSIQNMELRNIVKKMENTISYQE